MKNLVNLLVLGILALFINGCATTGTYNQDYVSYNLKNNLKKVETKKVIIKENQANVITKKPDSMRGKLTSIDMQTTSINNNIAKEFLGQYFNLVSIQKEIKTNYFLVLDSKVLDYNYAYGTIADGVSMDIKLQVKIIKKNKVILEKTYKERVDNKVILTLNLDLKNSTINTFHKGLLWIYEYKVKPDLLTALRENM